MGTTKYSVGFSLTHLLWLFAVCIACRKMAIKTMAFVHRMSSIGVGIYVVLHYTIFFLLLLDAVAEGWLLDGNGFYRLLLAPQPLLVWLSIHLKRMEATRSHPSDVELTAENLVEGVALVELLVSFASDHFGDLLDRLSNDLDDSRAGVIRKFELVRDQLASFYADKSARPLDEATSFLAPAAEIVSGDEDSLMRLMIVVYGVAASTNHISTKEFNELLTASSPDVQQFTNEMVREFATELSGNGRSDSTQENVDLRSKLKQTRLEIAQLKDEKSKLEFELSQKEIELTKYAEMHAMSQEVEMKAGRLEHVQDQLRIAEDHCSKLELRVGELSGREETLSKEVSKLRESLKSVEEELREARDNKAALEHRLSIATARSNEMEQKFARLQESSSQKPSERDHAALKDRYQKMLKRNSELEQQCQSLESYKMLLDSHKAQLEQVKAEKEGVLNELYTEQERSRELKGRLKEVENARLSVQAETSEPTGSFDYGNVNEELIALKVEVSSLQSEKKRMEEELSRTNAHVESEKERSGALLAQVRLESEQLALKHETLQNEFMRQKQELDSAVGKCKRMEEERAPLQNYVNELELAVKRSGFLIQEYVIQNEDGSSTGITGSECLALRAEVQRLQEQLQNQRISADAYRHIATEEQRLITNEWYEQALNYVQQKHLAPMCTSSHSDPDSLTTSAYDAQPYSPHLSQMQSTVLSARSTPQPQERESMANSTSSALTDSMNSSVETGTTSGILSRITRSFLRQQHDHPARGSMER
ncbi:hypothetical protein M3Y99_00834100 [Aphelenchoides fujianensis]|nr:hypothetical protein M3Y99_00834100 [Aphelenchoides fujianensis]